MAKIAPFSPLPPDLYEQEVNFAELALQFPDFAKRLKPNGQLDFSDPESVRQLTKSLLRRDFDLEIELPEDRLCPPVPNRYNYILWVQKLVESSGGLIGSNEGVTDDVIGLDIGTGASCIYPLLGCRARPNWKFMATDVDSKSLQYANKNIVLNEMSSKITLVTSTLDGPLIPEKIFEQTPYLSFTMTNPPFYSSTADLLSSAASKSRPPYSSCTGAPIEMIYETPDPTISNLGGELSFIFRLLAQSMQQDVRTNVQWFTTMFGKLSSASALTEKLQEVGCTNYAVTEFAQGSKTRRWGVGWSWLPYRPSEAAARGTEGLGRVMLPPKTELAISLPIPSATRTLSPLSHYSTTLNDLLHPIPSMTWTWDSNLCTGIGKSPGNVWSRRARRQRQRQQQQQQSPQPPNDPPHATSSTTSSSSLPKSNCSEEPLFEFQISLRCHHRPQSQDKELNPSHPPHPTSLPTTTTTTTTSSPNPPTNTPIPPFQPEPTISSASASLILHIRFLKGHDPVVFESFCEMVRRGVLGVGKGG